MLTILSEASNWDFTMANYSTVWAAIIQFGILLLALLLGNLIRNLVPILRKSLIPSALIGGLLLLAVIYILYIFDIYFINTQFMQVITYHGLGIGFVAMTLKTVKTKKRVGQMKINEASVFCGASYMLQGMVGLGVTIVLYLITKNSNQPIFYASGAIMALGFAQGPGNALTWDRNFTTNYASLFQGNGSFGLTIASIGFIVAAVVGVLYINILRHQGKIKERIADPEMAKSISMYEGENEIPDSESIDKFSVQLGFVALGYGISFLVMFALGEISSFTNSLAWGFNFLWGVFAAMGIKALIKLLQKKKIVKRNYINNYQMDRISGFAFDIMIVAGVASIDINVVRRYALPLVILCVLGTIVTYGYTLLVAKKLFKGYSHEFFVMNFGCLTGTASNGMILLKEIDPNFETPTANVYISSQVGNMITACPLLLLMAFMAKSLTNAVIAFAIFAVLFVVYNIFLFRKYIFKKHYKDNQETEWVPDESVKITEEANLG